MEVVPIIISVLALIIAVVTGYFYLRSVVDQTRREFRDNQPNLRVTDLSSMRSGDLLTLFLNVRNIGKAPAYDCTVSLDGWEGQPSIATIHPPGARFQEHKLSIPLGLDSPVRTTVIDPARLRLRFRDRWGQQYQVWYSVTQVKEEHSPIFTIQIDLQHPGMLEPSPSFFEMRKLLRNITLYD